MLNIGIGVAIGTALDAGDQLAQTAEAPAIEGQPALSGEVRVAQVLTAVQSPATGNPMPDRNWQWFRNGAPIPGGTSNTLVLGLADEGALITVQQIETNSEGTASATSAAVGPVVHVAPVAANGIGNLTLEVGTAIAPLDIAADFTGEDVTVAWVSGLVPGLSLSNGILSGTPSSVTGPTPVQLVFRGTNSGGFADSGFEITTVDALSLVQTQDNRLELENVTGLVTLSIDSPAVYSDYDTGNGSGVFTFSESDLAGGPENLVPPQIQSGILPGPGSQLSLLPGLWVYDPENAGLLAPTYQWQSDLNGNGVFADITGADGAAYLLAGDDLGNSIRVVETLSDGAGTRSSASVPISVPDPTVFVPAYAGGITLPAPVANPTLGNVPAGNPDADRWVLVVVTTITGTSGDAALAGITLNGVPTSLLAGSDGDGIDHDRFVCFALSTQKVPTGTTASVSISWQPGYEPAPDQDVRVWAYTIQSPDVPIVADAGYQPNSGDIVVNIEPDDAIIAMVTAANGSDPASAWSGATHRDALELGSSGPAEWVGIADDLAAPNAGTRTITCNLGGQSTAAIVLRKSV